MRRKLLLVVIALMTAFAMAVPAGAAPKKGPAAQPVPIGVNGPLLNIGIDTDNGTSSLGEERKAGMALATQAKLVGKASGPVAEVAKGQFVELAREGEDSILTITGEFGTLESPFGVLQGGAEGPLHNEIPEPDRSVDNTTIWAPDFSEEYYEELLFSDAMGAVSMRNFYIEQSSNRYTVNGDVTDWVTVPYRAAHYGRDYCGSIVCAQTWVFVRDSVDAWYNTQAAAGMTVDEINDYLAPFDVWDRYDYDGDGNFDEPDGYIDHFQSVHAGEGQETGGGSYGADAIWSHRWYVQLTPIGGGGPTVDGEVVPFGGTQIGGSNYWIGDYTIEPENGGVGVFAHEFGHDLDLPDLYDTSGNVGGAENSTGFWTLMSSGSYGSTGNPEDGIGSKPIPLSAYEKIFLGWSNYEVVGYGEKASLKLGPASATTKQAQQLVLLLPDKQVEEPLGAAHTGSGHYFSGSGNDLENSMVTQVGVPAGTTTMSFWAKFDIEDDYDFAFLTINGETVQTNWPDSVNLSGLNPDGHGIAGSTTGAWVEITADVSTYAGETVDLGFSYLTDGGLALAGFQVDDININGVLLGGEVEDEFELDGFQHVVDGVATSFAFNAYFAEYRNYRGYDDGLRTGPYNFGFLDNLALGNWVEHFPYQDGLLVWYYDESYPDNNVGANCASLRGCGGLYLPVDAHPELMLRPDNGQVWRPRVQSHDSTFGLQKTDEICLHMNSVEGCYGGLPANPMFDDTVDYWFPAGAAPGHLGWASVPLPKTGTTIRVASTSGQGNFMQVHVNK